MDQTKAELKETKKKPSKEAISEDPEAKRDENQEGAREFFPLEADLGNEPSIDFPDKAFLLAQIESLSEQLN